MRNNIFLKLNHSSRITLSIPFILTATYCTIINNHKKRSIKCDDNNGSSNKSRTTDNTKIKTSKQQQLLLTKSSKEECYPSWVKESMNTKAKCWIHNYHDHNHNNSDTFDPATSHYFEIQLMSSPQTKSIVDNNPINNASVITTGCENECNMKHDDDGISSSNPILHNTIIVLPNLLTNDECRLIIQSAENIIDESKGVTTEKWAIYPNFNIKCQNIMQRLLQNYVLSFMELQLPDITNRLFHEHQQHCNEIEIMPMEYYWDDPVVIKYNEGNKLAPHEDMRDLTIVIPLNPLDNNNFRPLVGGGTRFWLEGSNNNSRSDTAAAISSSKSASTTTADDNSNRDDDADKGIDSGVLLHPSPGSGIIFNGDIVHSGEAVIKGTRFVLMTSINLDNDYDDDIDNNDDDDDD